MLGNGEQLESWIFSEPMNKVIPKFTKGQCITINVLDSSSTVFYCLLLSFVIIVTLVL